MVWLLLSSDCVHFQLSRPDLQLSTWTVWSPTRGPSNVTRLA